MTRNFAALALIVVLTGFLGGCAAAGLTVAGAGAGVAMGSGVEHTLSGITYKTFTASANELRFASLKALDRMGMKLNSDEKTEDGFKMVAVANQRTIEIDIERLTETASRMRVVANKGDIFFKDSATATEVILQTAEALNAPQAVAGKKK
jgi:hypothetical protein